MKKSMIVVSVRDADKRSTKFHRTTLYPWGYN